MTVDYLTEQTKQNRQLIFDLDNTIYLETEFLFKVYDQISKTAVNVNPKIVVVDFLSGMIVKQDINQ